MFTIFDQVLALSNKLMFSINNESKRNTVLVIGEMGNGKSTTMNELIGAVDILFGREEDPDQEYFDADQSTSAVTTSCSQIVTPEIKFIDSPGFNDPNPARSDVILSRELIHYLKMESVLSE
mgnify:CR=1 FL=1